MKSNEELEEMKKAEAQELKELKKEAKGIRDEKQARQALINDIERIRRNTERTKEELGQETAKKDQGKEGLKKVWEWIKEIGYRARGD